MSKRNKLKKFADILSFPNVYENYNPKEPKLIAQDGVEVDLKGKWANEHFKNNNTITLELACGRGEYTLPLARMYPDRNFIGVDVKGARLWKGASIALEENLNNAAFLRTRIEQLPLFFAEAEVSEIWITFPDPFLKKRKANRRLTALPFLDRYRKVLEPDGLVHLKTDDKTMSEFTLLTIANDEGSSLLYFDDDIYSKALPIPELGFKTYYEKMHLAKAKTIKYIRFKIF